MTFGCTKHKKKNWFGLMNDANKKNIAAMTTKLSDAISGNTLCGAYFDYNLVMKNKRKNIQADLWSDLAPAECIHEDEEWETEDGKTCREIMVDSKKPEFTLQVLEETCQKKDKKNNYVYDKCNCLECDPQQCVGKWDDENSACNDSVNWGLNRKELTWIKEGDAWAGKTCELAQGTTLEYHSMDCPFIVNCIGGWVDTDECVDNKLVEFYSVTEMNTYTGDDCTHPPGTRRGKAGTAC